MSEILFSYPKPKDNPNCVCVNGAESFFCAAGHLVECHSGMRCDLARCSHLPRYSDGEMTDYEIRNAPGWKVEIKYQGNLLNAFQVFAPTAEMVREILNGWIQIAKNLKKVQNELEIKITGENDDS